VFPGALFSFPKRMRQKNLFAERGEPKHAQLGPLSGNLPNPDFASALATWLDRVLALYGERVLPLDLQIARRWGQLSAALGNDSADLMISATALEHGLTVVTRNVSDFEPTGVATLNPFGSQPSRKR